MIAGSAAPPPLVVTMRHLPRFVLFTALSALASPVAGQPLTVTSPSGAITISVDVVEGRPTYAVTAHGREVIRPSALGLALEGAPRLDTNFTMTGHRRRAERSAWRPVYGERSEVPDRYDEVRVEFRERIPPGRTLAITFRAYDEGAAFRYEVPQQAHVDALVIGDDLTEFRLPDCAYGWPTAHVQATYQRVSIRELDAVSERPFLLELPNGEWAALAEAGVEASSSMFIAPLAAERHSVRAKLMGPVTARTPYASPWRVVLAGERPGDLLEHNYLLLNLSPPSRLASTEWIRPGKVLREVTLSTRGGREAVDFAAAHGLQYIEYDAGWYGYEYDDASDARRVSVDPRRLRPEPEYQGLDLPGVLAYAKSKGVGVWLYVNRRALERQIDDLLPLFASWGVVGVKYGFVNVNTHPWTQWLYEAIAKAGEHRLMLDIHDEFRPTGMSRTYPHLLTQEGIRGNEEFPDATQGTILPFTRMLAGAGDHTFCWLDPRLKHRWSFQLAHAVVIYSPLQFLYWYDRASAIADSPGVEWFARLPTVWDDTRVLLGRPGEPVAVARRKGEQWFLGVVSNDQPNEVEVPLSMLDEGRRYTVELYEDGEGPRDVRKRRVVSRRGDTLQLQVQARGGVAIVFTPEAR